MATTAKLKPEGNYEIFQNGQRVATGTESILSQYGLSPQFLSNEATTPSGQKVNPITGQIITSDALKDTTPFNPATPDFTPPSDISGLQPAEIKMTPQEVKQTDLEKRMAELQLSLASKPAFEAEKRTEFGVLNAQQAYDDLNTQLRDLQRQQQLVPLDIQRQSEGRGRTEGGVEPLEIGKRRALAYDALTTSSLIDAAQGRLASAERKVIEAVNQKFAPDEAMYDALLKNLNLIKNSPETTVQEMNRANQQEAIIKARQEATAKAKEQATNIINWANKAAENMAKQGTLDPVMLNKIKNSKTESEAFALAAPFLAVKDKLTGQSDFEQAFLRDNGRLPTVSELQAYKTSQEKPTFQTFERAGHTIRQVLDREGNVLSETDLGAEKISTSKIDDKIDKGETIDATNILENPNLSSSEKNNLTLQSILTSSKVSATNKTQIGYVLGVVEAAKSLAELNPAGSFTGVSPFTSILNVKIPWTKIGLPFRNALKREQTVKNETFINGIILQTGYWASGATLTAQQLELVDKMTPNMSDTDKNVQTKINTLTNFMLDQTKAKLQAEGINFKPQKVDLFETNNLLNKASEEQLKILQKEGLL